MVTRFVVDFGDGLIRVTSEVPDHSGRVLFVAKGECEGSLTVIAEAVKQAHFLACSPVTDHASLVETEPYVYVLCDPTRTESEVFYVGKGVNKRHLQHARAVARLARTPRTSKEKKIAELLRQHSRDSLSRIVFMSPSVEAELQHAVAHAVEYYLITSIYGTFQLTNETSGNDTHGGFRWLALPLTARSSRGCLDKWNSALDEFVISPVGLSQVMREQLLLEEAIYAWSGLHSQLKKSGLPLDFSHFALAHRKPDVGGWVVFGSSPVAAHLKLSAKTPGVVVNLRRSPKVQSVDCYKEKIDKIMGEESIRNPRDPYVKICRVSSRVDAIFPIHDIHSSPHKEPSQELCAAGLPIRNLSLYVVLKWLSEKLDVHEVRGL
ncbi:hypothetical protein [Jeongeupia sp. USM3]|uniref:LEM-3-like GIY-YIG domain-containing protein n=1 Tax=Jeongeupia sp. USM3 TaxID=1906741 RepID=UPI0011AB314C|nr:hypothetical protein [Jeongeupia sp. USM3]